MAMKPPVYKRYQCNVWPEYRIRDCKFKQGILEVFNKRDADLVENTDNYGVLIWEIPLEEPVVRVQDEFAHQGTQATQNTEAQEHGEADSNDDPKPEEQSDEVAILGGGYYEFRGVKVRGKKNLPPEAQGLV
jgi:hypothetical protein